ncbi:2'-5' RNA ligase [Deinococcus piscis]|uniref:2'-5' RNA ligase n=1 Tax=Deinococcus piscis TaxID=394230 RepID=A0ABQ3K8C9_9DEIO|nr:2'-5' RNA ligase family protein [Deinococcus piscis]GHG07360.1 2'-5' RNA ligase [Deinococcus piscis]
MLPPCDPTSPVPAAEPDRRAGDPAHTETGTKSPASADPISSGVMDGAYSLVAWPPPRLDGWLRKLQDQLGVSGFGVPHINLRAPFQTELSRRELIERFRDVLDGASSFEVSIKGFKRYKGVIFLECETSARMLYLHLMALSVGPSTRSPYDGESYAPHLTLALGVLPWAEDDLWERVTTLELPLTHFQVSALSLTIEEKGEFLELHTFPLTDPAAGTPPPHQADQPEADPPG